jgi:RHS repeat-associated protein
MKKPKHGRQRPDQSNQTHVLLAVDRQNSVLAELNNDDLNKVRYSAYGQRSAELDPVGSMAFNGEFREPDTGWYLLGNGYRAYNPVLMRFHSPDSLSPFGSGGLNTYSYCVGDPINRSDPTGHFAFSMLSLALYRIAAGSTIAGVVSLTAGFLVKEDSTKKGLLIGGGILLGAGLGIAGYARFGSKLGGLLRRSNAPGPRPRSRSSMELEFQANFFSSPAMREMRARGDIDPLLDMTMYRHITARQAARGRDYLPSVNVLFPNSPPLRNPERPPYEDLFGLNTPPPPYRPPSISSISSSVRTNPSSQPGSRRSSAQRRDSIRSSSR